MPFVFWFVINTDTKDIRLQGGSHPLEGRVEVRVQGQWRTVCDEGWDDLDATTVCRMLTDFPIDGYIDVATIMFIIIMPEKCESLTVCLLVHAFEIDSPY